MAYMGPKELTWIKLENSNHLQDYCSVVGGYDLGRRTLYVARAYHNGGLIVGKIQSGWSHASVPYGCQEHWKSDFEILTAPRDSLKWVNFNGKDIPPNAVVGGYDPGSATYYIGRAHHEGTLTNGKVHGNICFISFGYREHAYRSFEILVRC